MGGHGGLNILPQKRWNVYREDNRAKVRKDEEAAAKEEQLKREQSRKKDTEFRLEQLRAARGLDPIIKPESASKAPESEQQEQVAKPSSESERKDDKDDGRHINLFEGIKIFDPIFMKSGEEGERKKRKKEGDDGEKDRKRKRPKKEEEVRVVTAEDEKFRLGYGLAGKGVKTPWYLEKKSDKVENGDDVDFRRGSDEWKKSVVKKKKTVEELREERLKREKIEKERQRAVLAEQSRRDGGFSRRRSSGFSR
ncbi:hypothetical protein LINGRAHAP2_LOCUS3537 [Linum grandiflorum]